jgi:septal ring factor EnvC (AmiA/AmiB activator)
MKNSLRNIIREQIEKLLEADTMSPTGDAINDLQTQVADTLDYLKNLEDETESDVKTGTKLLNVKKQARSNSPTSIKVDGKSYINPERAAKNAEVPAEDKILGAKEKSLDKIKNTTKNYEKMAKELEKKELEMLKTQKGQGEKTSVLPSLGSAI